MFFEHANEDKVEDFCTNLDSSRKSVHEVKIAIIGPGNVGKTTIANAFRDHRYFDRGLSTVSNSANNHLLRYSKTLGADLFKKKILVKTILSDVVPSCARPKEGNPALRSRDAVDITIWDTAGFERFDTIGIPSPLILNGCDVVITCFSCDDLQGIENVEILMNHLEKNGKLGKHCVHLILCTKADVSIPLHELTRKTGVLLNAQFIGRCHEEGGTGILDLSLLEKIFSKDASMLDKFKIVMEKEMSMNSESKKLNGNEPLLACTSSFCSTALCTANPVFCILYAVFLHLARKTEFMKYNSCLQPFNNKTRLYERKKLRVEETKTTINLNATTSVDTSLQDESSCC